LSIAYWYIASRRHGNTAGLVSPAGKEKKRKEKKRKEKKRKKRKKEKIFLSVSLQYLSLFFFFSSSSSSSSSRTKMLRHIN